LDESQDIEDCYFESGEPMLPPHKMRERLYNVVRVLKEAPEMERRDYMLKKNDIIKTGRVKYRVKTIFNAHKSEL